MAHTSGPIARSTASASPNGTCVAGPSGPKPSRYFGVIESEPRVRPWNAFSNATTRTRSFWPTPKKWWRASLSIASLASVPELQKKARSKPVRRHSSSARLDVRFVVEPVGDVHQRRRLVGDGAHERRVRVPDDAHGDAGAEVEHAATLGVEELAAAAAHEGERRGPVVRVEALLRQGHEVRVRGHCARRPSTGTRRWGPNTDIMSGHAP